MEELPLNLLTTITQYNIISFPTDLDVVNQDHEHLLEVSIIHQRLRQTEILLEYKKVTSYKPVILAVQNQDLDCLNLLISMGCPLHFNALNYARNKDCFLTLISAGCPIGI